MDEMKLHFVMLVGFPGSGKSTLVSKRYDYPKYSLVSSDYHVERMARILQSTYDDVFKTSVKEAHKHMYADLDVAIAYGNNIVWDQTNLTEKTRRVKLAMIPSNYRKTCVWVRTDEGTLMERLANRPGKKIPYHVTRSMIDNFEPPSLAEGFEEIETYDC